MPAFRLVLLIPLLAGLVPPGALAAEPSGGQPVAPQLSPASAASPDVQEVAPKVFYLKDKEGNLVPVPDFSFDRYEELVAQEIAGNASKPPPFSFADVIQFTGKADEKLAEFDVVFPLRFTVREGEVAGWVRIPLRLDQAILTAPPQLDLGREVFLEYGPKGEGYIAWIRPTSDALQRLTLHIKLPLKRSDGQTQLALATPRTPLRLQVELVGGAVEGRVGSNEENFLATQHPAPDRTLLVVDGTGDGLELYWQEKTETPSMLEATGTVLVAVNGGRIQCDAKLRVHSYGSSIESFLVRLPPDIELAEFNQPGLRLTVNDTVGAPNGEQQVLVRRLDGKTSDPIEVRLVAGRRPKPGSLRTPIELGGFEVVGAVRQWGSYEFSVDGEWQIDFTAGQNVQRVEEVPDVARQQKVVARFDYYRQPCSLKVELLPKQTKLSVDPLYIFRVGPDRVQLDARLRYKMTGPRTKEVKLDLGGWVVDRVTPEELLAEPVAMDSVTPLRIPLVNQSIPAGGDVELRLEAHRDLAAQQPLTIAPLRCPESIASAALLIIAAADNAEIIPEASGLKGLLPDRLPASLDSNDFSQPPLVYREELSAEGSLFVGRVRKRDQSVSVAVDTEVTAEAQRLNVRQLYSYQVAYEPLSKLLFEVPGALSDIQGLRILADQEELPFVEDVAEKVGGPVRIHVDLENECIGHCAIGVSYFIALPELKLNAQRDVRLPLVQPLNDSLTTVTQNKFHLTTADNMAAEVTDDRWSTTAAEQQGVHSANGHEYVSEGRRAVIAIAVSRIPSRPQQTTMVHRAWLQVWMTKEERRDRAVYQLTSDQDHLEIRLPPNAYSNGVEVWLSGRRISDFTVSENRSVVVPLHKDEAAQGQTLELFYWFSLIDPPIGRLNVELPIIEGASRAGRFYLQLILPRSEYLLWSSESLTRELTWRWQGAYWGREANLRQADLEDWLVASRQPPLPRQTNQYLFSSLGTLVPRAFISAKRQVILLALSGAALVACLWLIYFPVLRHPAVLVAGALGLATFGALYPDPAILAAQAAAVGIALVPVARLLRWTLSDRRKKRAPARSAVYSKPDSKVGETAARPAEGSSRVSGATTPYRVTVADSQS